MSKQNEMNNSNIEEIRQHVQATEVKAENDEMMRVEVEKKSLVQKYKELPLWARIAIPAAGVVGIGALAYFCFDAFGKASEVAAEVATDVAGEIPEVVAESVADNVVNF